MTKRKQISVMFLRFFADLAVFFFCFSVINLAWNTHLFAGWPHTLINAEIVAAVLVGFRNPWLLSLIKQKQPPQKSDEGGNGEMGVGVPANPIPPLISSGIAKPWHDKPDLPAV